MFFKLRPLLETIFRGGLKPSPTFTYNSVKKKN